MKSGDKSFAHYTIAEKIGAGGMGEVFRATDSKLNRDVALKMLPDTVAQDPERLARFRREAQVLAALNHHGIAGIYGLESEGERYALAMELVSGPDLSERLASGSLSVEEGLKVALELAEAGSVYFTRPHLADYLVDADEIGMRAGDLFRAAAGGKLVVSIDREFPLEEARRAHEAMEARQSRGKILLTIE